MFVEVSVIPPHQPQGVDCSIVEAVGFTPRHHGFHVAQRVADNVGGYFHVSL